MAALLLSALVWDPALNGLLLRTQLPAIGLQGHTSGQLAPVLRGMKKIQEMMGLLWRV